MANAHDLLMAQRAAMMANAGEIIPSDCVEVDYISTQSNFNQYLDTGFFPDENSGLEISFERLDYVKEETLAGVYTGYSSGFNFNINMNTEGNIRFDGAVIRNDGSMFRVGVNETFKINKNGVWSNGYMKGFFADVSAFNSPFPLLISARSLNGVAGGFSSLKIYSYRIMNGDNIVQDCIPVKRITDGLGYFCNKLTGLLYGNSGSGVFEIGPEKT